jgi:hypothetical protein
MCPSQGFTQARTICTSDFRARGQQCLTPRRAFHSQFDYLSQHPHPGHVHQYGATHFDMSAMNNALPPQRAQMDSSVLSPALVYQMQHAAQYNNDPRHQQLDPTALRAQSRQFFPQQYQAPRAPAQFPTQQQYPRMDMLNHGASAPQYSPLDSWFGTASVPLSAGTETNSE